MRYLKLYEAFESEKISKTIKFLNKDAVIKFKDIIQRICNVYDFPYSRLNDDMFEYLPYGKAIKVNKDLSAKDCKQSSTSHFRSNGVEGEFCNNGRIKRKWGAGTRMVECPNCKGTGVEPTKYNLSKIKFWFDVNGNYVGTTGCDGSKTESVSLSGSFSRNKSDYEVTRFIDKYSDLVDIKGGCYVFISDFANRANMVVYLNGLDSGNLYMFQNMLSAGNYPDNVDNNISTHIVGLSDGLFRSYFRTNGTIGCELLKPKNPDNIKTGSVTINDRGLSIGRGSISPDRGFIKTNSLKDAHFALILDIDELKGIEYKKRSKTKEEREESREDAYALMTDKSIKSANIERYLKKIMDMSKMSMDSNHLLNIKRTILRVMGGVDIIYFINNSGAYNGISSVNNITTNLYHLLKSIKDGDNNSDYYLDSTNSSIRNSLNSINKYKITLSSKIDQIMETTKKNNEDENRKVLSIHEMVLDLSKFIYEHIKDRELKNIEDLEILVQDITYINSLITGDRISLYELRNYFSHLIPRNYFSHLIPSWGDHNPYYDLNRVNIDNIRDNINSIKNIIERRLK